MNGSGIGALDFTRRASAPSLPFVIAVVVALVVGAVTVGYATADTGDAAGSGDPALLLPATAPGKQAPLELVVVSTPSAIRPAARSNRRGPARTTNPTPTRTQPQTSRPSPQRNSTPAPTGQFDSSG